MVVVFDFRNMNLVLFDVNVIYNDIYVNRIIDQLLFVICVFCLFNMVSFVFNFVYEEGLILIGEGYLDVGFIQFV